MIKIENTYVDGWAAAIRGMRNPLNSWDKSDSNLAGTQACWNPQDEMCEWFPCEDCHVGPNDLALMQKLAAAGTDHGKYLRMITITADITAPRFFWEQFATYRVGVTMNSCSTMHTITDKEFTLDDFSLDETSVTDRKVEQKIIPIEVDREEWRDLQSIPNVIVSNTGRVKTKPYEMKLEDGRVRHYGEKELSILKDTSNGYQNVSIRMLGKTYHCKLHRLMAEAFIENPKNLPCINHKDGNKLNNNLRNLEWVSFSENRQHAVDNGLVYWSDIARECVGEASRKLEDKEICEILLERAKGETLDNISKKHNVSCSIISRVCSGLYYTRRKTPLEKMQETIDELNRLRELYQKTGNKAYWRMIIEKLPQSYNQRRTVQLNYQVAHAMHEARKSHKLTEWLDFCKWVERLPYYREIFGGVKNG